MSKNNQMTVSENQLNLITSAILLGICLFCYYPGLTGPFIFDDFPNLESLGYYNGVRNLDTLLKYLSSGFAGPTGRPLSLLSFLINSTNWPADPFSFKLTNLLLHCATGIFLFLLCRQLQLSFNTDHQKAFFIALIATSFWLLHPFFVSTVLYVIQRMAMLSAFFSVISLWFYCSGRLLMSHDLNRGYIHITLAICLGTLLAVLSKENGALLPFLILIVEYCIFHHPDSKAKPLNRFWLVFFLIVPSVIILGYIISHITPYSLSHPYPRRSFNLTERLLTEARVVTGYLHSLLIPRMNYPGVLYENILISKSLWNPVQTFFCVVFILLLPVFAVFIRKYAPLLALAILFFCSGHLLESTTLGLEIYFEHRNYLPAIFLFLPIGQLFVRYKNK
ncbi:MAG: hypothetical protein U1E01_22220, partial [Methylicorpusculum sp.]|nr:hypothetical protein [Methylicorpusculum sp.]